jgi:hypothetical protein
VAEDLAPIHPDRESPAPDMAIAPHQSAVATETKSPESDKPAAAHLPVAATPVRENAAPMAAIQLPPSQPPMAPPPAQPTDAEPQSDTPQPRRRDQMARLAQPAAAHAASARASDPSNPRTTPEQPMASEPVSALSGLVTTQATAHPPAEQSVAPPPRPEPGVAIQPQPLPARVADSLPAIEPTARPEPTAADHVQPDADVALSTRRLEGLNELDLRLTQSELGRVDVRLSIPEKGRLEAIVAADNPAALDLLRRDGAELARALAAAAPSSDGASLSFQSRTPDEQSSRRGPARSRSPIAAHADEPATEWRPVATSGRIERIA